jgi:hypothetical protein
MPTEPQPITLRQVVQRAVDVVDPAGADADVGDLLARFEDDDEPVRAVDDVQQRLADAAADIDPELENPAVQMAAATATYLAFRRDEVHEDPTELLRLVARAEFDGHPPEPVASWLSEAGVDF